MSNRATLGLALVALLLFSFIVLVERDTLSTGDVEGRNARIIPRFRRDRVSRVEVEAGDGPRLVLERREPASGDAEEALWWMLEPVETLADEEMVHTLLGLLEYSDVRRRIPGLTPEDRASFALDEPRIRLVLQVATERVELSIGGEAPRGEGHYAWVPGADEALVIGLDVVEGIGRDPSAYRSRRVFPEGLVGLDSLALDDAEGERRLERVDGRWWLTAPTRMLASRARLRELQRRLRELEVTNFSPELEGIGDPFAEPGLSLELRLGGARDETRVHRLRFGGECPAGEGAEARYAQLDEGETLCVAASAVAEMSVGPEALRELRALIIEEVDVESLDYAGAEGALTVRSDQGVWSLQSGGGVASVDADALSEWLGAARRVRATGVRPASDASLRAAGLNSPSATLTLHARGEISDAVLRIGRVEGDLLLLRRDDEPVILEVPALAAAALVLSPVKLRGRVLVHENEEALISLSVERASEGVERVVREGGRFWVNSPARAPADRVVVRDVVSRLATLSVLSFVAESARPDYGLDAPRFVMAFSFQGARPDQEEGSSASEGERAHRLVVGNETEGGAYARLDDDPAVFILPLALIELVRAPLISRDLLATQTLHLDRLEIQAGAARLILRDQGEGLEDSDGDIGPAAVAERAQSLATLRASSVLGYSTQDAAYGLESPRARISVARDAAAGAPPSYVLLVGSEDGAGGVHVRREDLPVTFVVPAPSIARLLGESP